MKQSMHTRGPWIFGPKLTASENDRGFTLLANGMWLADTNPIIKNNRGDASEEGRANARLMAASPDLLEALIQCRAVLVTAKAEIADETAQRVLARRIETASAAIAKATGGSP